MWQSMLMATPVIGSARTIGIEGFSHSYADFPKVRNLQTQASYRLAEKFRPIALYPKSTAIRVSDSSTTDSVTSNFDENGNNDRCIIAAKKRYDEISSVLDLLSHIPFLESKLDDMELNLDEELVTGVLLENRYLLGNNVVDFVKWAAERDSRIVNKKILDALIRAVSWEDETTKLVYSLWGFLQEAVWRYNVSTTTEMLNEVIELFSEFGEGMAAYLVFNSFENLQCERDANSYYLTVKALYMTDNLNTRVTCFEYDAVFSEKTVFDAACLVCEKMITKDMLPEGENVGDIIRFLCVGGGRVKEAISVYKSATQKKIDIPRESLICLVNSLCSLYSEG